MIWPDDLVHIIYNGPNGQVYNDGYFDNSSHGCPVVK